MMRTVFLLGLVLIAGCQNHGSMLANIETQGQANVEIVATEYYLQVSFKARSNEQESLINKLSTKLEKFETWSQQHKFLVHAGHHQMRPIYQYPQGKPRELVEYEVVQNFTLSKLKFEQYQLALSELNSFRPENISLKKVIASDLDKQEAESILTSRSFLQARHKAELIAQQSNLCELKVSHVKEHSRSNHEPRMMQMEALASKSLHSTQSRQKFTMTLNVSWIAHPCS